MNIAQVPQNAATADRKTAALCAGPARRTCLTRAVAGASLVAGAILLGRGERAAGLSLAAAGTLIALLEDPKAAADLWKGLPGYIDAGQGLLTRLEKFVEELGEQGNRIRVLLAKQAL